MSASDLSVCIGSFAMSPIEDDKASKECFAARAHEEISMAGEHLATLTGCESDSENSTELIPVNLKTIWETKKLEKILSPERKRMWKCHHCNKSWSEWNHTKAVRHVTGDGKDIAS